MILVRPKNYRSPSSQQQGEPVPTDAGSPPAASSLEAQANITQILKDALSSRFEVCRCIAIGGMATLFQVRHLATGGLFAAKIMHPALAHDQTLVRAFSREAHVGARLAGHPNAVAILDVGLASDVPYLLMPFVDGRDLDQVLAEHGQFPRDEAFMLLAQLASLLMYSESQGVVHADIALGNIRLDSFGQYRLLDYGLARQVDEPLEHLPSVAGTPAFNSPEQLRGEPLDIRSDLYSLGLIFFHVLTGKSAFPADESTNLDDLAQAHLQGSWTLPEPFATDTPVASLIQKLLATDREQRMASAFELGGALTALGFELPSFARSLPDVLPPLPRVRRRRLEAI